LARSKSGSKFASYEEPKAIDADLTEKEAAFVLELVDNHLEPLEAFYAAGYTCNQSKALAKNRSKRLQRYLWLHIEKRIKEKVSETATLAISVLEKLMREADSENVRLNAARDILSRAGYDAVHKQETTVREANELSDEELDTQIERLSNVVKIA
jgi:predicted DNA-binding protein|tara:strand:- start:267 stop:731 length:465 start_codon:yes stop_codon:yes gene_type:complete